MPEQEEIKELSDLNIVAANELKLALAANEELQPAWKEAALRLVEKGVPHDLEPLRRLAAEAIND